MTTNADVVGAGTANVQNSHRLKGIINTNDDPFSCAFCAKGLVDSTWRIAVCCGKEVCESCHGQMPEEARVCSLCGTKSEKGLKVAKKHSRKGCPCAQYVLASLYDTGHLVRRSPSEAFRMFEMAAKSGHPGAMEKMGKIFLDGTNNITADLSKACHYFEKVLAVDGWYHDRNRAGLLRVAEEYLELESDEATSTAKSILLSIAGGPAEDPNVFKYSDALYLLGLILETEEDFGESTKILTESFLECTTFSMREKRIGGKRQRDTSSRRHLFASKEISVALARLNSKARSESFAVDAALFAIAAASARRCTGTTRSMDTARIAWD